MTELYSMTASELAPLIEEKQLSPVELMQSIMNQIDEVDPEVNAYITILEEQALNQARHAENEIMNGLYKGPLHGIPIGIKDNYYTKGVRTTVGSEILQDFVPDYTATAVEKLQCAGGIMTGKLNMHEFGGGLTNTNPFYGDARNPWDLQRTPGGSSGGSSAVLAAGLSTLATGTDTFGSIRVPAALTGTYGLKPTYGLVSGYGVAPLAWSMDHAGPMARSVSDLAIMLTYMAGYDPDDPGSIKAPVPDYYKHLNKGIDGVKIGVPRYFIDRSEPEVINTFQSALATLENMGAEVIEIEIPKLDMASYAGYLVTIGEGSSYHYNRLRHQPEDFASDVRIFFNTGTLTTSPQYVTAQQVRRSLNEAFQEAFEDVDLIATPMTPYPAPRFKEDWISQNQEIIKDYMPFTAPAAATGIPSLSIPMGRTSAGLPLGLQLMSNHLTEKLLLQVGNAFEQR
ncbi:amidase [Alkalibacillus haloalkaliphilus]|uniref:Amidase n=1 Tax=Alkalibacillus haloalkaliphilus TaxID=94136 RepID=A0A511W404_9BACI|nr:amidase [Alkalibacillus haloalkaliphilus]GEN45491.1 amidase [Alkalibacillus haloalkaliphilus]